MPAAPAPITTMSTSRGSGAAMMRDNGSTANAKGAVNTVRREIVIGTLLKTELF
jgi:hypothetical protein